MAEVTPDLRAAKEELRTHLVALFGTALRGVSGYGAGLDRQTRAPSLSVLTTSERAASRARASLPDTIGGVPVKVEQRNPAILE